MQTPPRSQKREPQSFLSPVEKTMRSLVAGTFSKDPSELARVFDAVKRGNKARIYSLIDNTCLIRDCFMQFRDDEKIGSLCFTIQEYVIQFFCHSLIPSADKLQRYHFAINYNVLHFSRFLSALFS